MFYLLQTDTIQKALGTAAASTPEKISMLSLLEKGGWIMYPLYFLLAAAIYVFVERLLAINKASRIEPNFMNIIRDNIVTGNVQAARNLAKNTNSPVARMIDKGIQRIGKPLDAIEKSMENVGRLEMYNIGMVQLFYGIASTGEYTLNTIAGGIYTKMITSATGLIIGLIAYVGYNFLSTLIDKTANKMEVASSEFIDILQEPTR
jgi:biopolymer transport protein ExbB